MLIVALLLAGIGWIIAAIAFEVGYQALKKKSTIDFNKGTACRIWWGLLSLLSMVSSPVIFLLNLPILLAISLSHIHLADGTDSVITVAEILRNIGPALRDASARIKPFLK